MKIEKLKEEVKTPRGELVPFKEGTATLLSILEFTCDSEPSREFKILSQKERMRLFKLNKRLAKDPDSIDIKANDITLLLEVAHGLFNSTLYGILSTALGEGDEEEEENESLTPTEE